MYLQLVLGEEPQKKLESLQLSQFCELSLTWHLAQTSCCHGHFDGKNKKLALGGGFQNVSGNSTHFTSTKKHLPDLIKKRPTVLYGPRKSAHLLYLYLYTTKNGRGKKSKKKNI